MVLISCIFLFKQKKLGVCVGSPKPDVSWYFNDVVLQETNTIKIHSNGTLVMENSGEENSGVYRCQAKNSFGVVSASANVEFNGEYVFIGFCCFFVKFLFGLVRFEHKHDPYSSLLAKMFLCAFITIRFLFFKHVTNFVLACK